MKAIVRKEIAKEISRQSNEYGSLMLKEKNKNKAMFYHNICHNLNKMANVFGLKASDFNRR